MLLRKRKQDNLAVVKSKKPILKQGIEQFVAFYFKKIFTILAIAMIPLLIIGCIIIAILSAILWFLPNTETSNNIQTFFSNSLNVQITQTADILGIGDVVGWAIDSFCAILYLIFIKPIVWLLGAMQDVVYFIGGGALSEQLFSMNNISTIYWLLFGIAMAIFIVIIGTKAIAWKSGKFAARNVVGKPIGLTQGISSAIKRGTPFKEATAGTLFGGFNPNTGGVAVAFTGQAMKTKDKVMTNISDYQKFKDQRSNKKTLHTITKTIKKDDPTLKKDWRVFNDEKIDSKLKEYLNKQKKNKGDKNNGK